ncbi:hypothetical protein [Vibrio sp. MEBiC08052]|uniref:hypothetical protein n=1 Tax=Vibrio sp. MEBiC08052 TaxID=1761910 RepID=UPI00074078D6|nr:hypothetical protein [Vibrio sp. MEBiC08052]KUI99607.1 hypothetical protein VRK_10530 [Vibrio sp. MEBiC08052]
MEEWLGFSGQDARKSRFWKAHAQANKKDFLVRLSSLKDELAHGALMPLKPKNVIVRQIWEPEAKKRKLVMQVFRGRNGGSVVWDAITFPISLPSPPAPQVLFHSRKSTPKCLGFEFSAHNQGRFYSLLLTKSLKFIPEFYPEIIDQLSFALKKISPNSNNHPPKKTIPGEWLGFSGQDARKSRFWTTCDAAKQKRSSGYACILARVTGALSTDVTETEKRNCASNLFEGFVVVVDDLAQHGLAVSIGGKRRGS